MQQYTGAYSAALRSSVAIQKLLKTHKRVILPHWVAYFFITMNSAREVCSETTATAIFNLCRVNPVLGRLYCSCFFHIFLIAVGLPRFYRADA